MMKKIKKVLFLVLFFAACFAIGVFIGMNFDLDEYSLVELIIALFVGYNVSIIVHEGGHLVFGLLSGYGFSSFRVWSLMLIKQDGKINIRRYKLAGTGGQCLLIPPEGDDAKTPIILYNLGGVVFNFILSALCVALYLAFPDVYILSLTLLVTAIISALSLLTNGIPLNVSGIANDGMNALSLSKDKTAKTAFLNQLRMNEAQTRGVRLGDMPEEWFRVPEGADRRNVVFASIAVFAVNRSFDAFDTEKSEREIEDLLSSDWNIIGIHRSLLKCDLAFCRLINRGSDADISLITSPEMQSFRKSMKKYPGVIRTEYALALLHDGNEAEAEKKLAAFEKVAKTSPHPADIASERELMDLALKKHKTAI